MMPVLQHRRSKRREVIPRRFGTKHIRSSPHAHLPATAALSDELAEGGEERGRKRSPPEHLGPEEASFGAFDDLLVDGLWWVVHDNSTLRASAA